LQRGGEVKPSVAVTWLTRNPDVGRIIVVSEKATPEPAER
jgi:hypothetical protein